MDINNTYQLKSLASRIRGMPHALTADELAEMLNMSRITILRRAKRGKIPSFRIGSSVRFDPHEQTEILHWSSNDSRQIHIGSPIVLAVRLPSAGFSGPSMSVVPRNVSSA